MKKFKLAEFFWFVLVVGLFVLSFKLLRSGTLEAELSSLGLFAPLVLVILKMSTLIIAPLGGTPLYVLGGAFFGLGKGFLLTFIGDVLGSTVCFLLARRYGVRILHWVMSENNAAQVLKVVGVVSSAKSYAKARLGFFSMPELLSYAAGLTRLNFWQFSMINAFFYLPVDLVLVFFGSELQTIGTRYLFILPILGFLFAISGFFLLYRDYQKGEGM